MKLAALWCHRCGRKFLMKDGYLFHASHTTIWCANTANMYATYSRIFSRWALKFRAVACRYRPGSAVMARMNFMCQARMPSPSSRLDYAANVELAEAVAGNLRPALQQARASGDTRKRAARTWRNCLPDLSRVGGAIAV